MVPLAYATTSPLLAWRDPIYILGGLAGVIALIILCVQPVLAAGVLPGLTLARSRRMHKWVGIGLVAAVLVHVIALWATSPPDTIDALLFASPTPFATWGVIAMWALFLSALLVTMRSKLRLRPRHWRLVHACLASIIVSGSIAHALLIEGTMETLSKTALCLIVIGVTLRAITKMVQRLKMSA